MSELAIETRNLVKVFHGGITAVNGLDLSIPSGTVYGLIGRNGAGKTTLLRLIMGLLRPTAGTAQVLGSDLWTAPPAVRARVAYVPQLQHLHAWMTLDELCRYVSYFYPKWDSAYAKKLSGRFGLPADRTVQALSGGQQQKVAILLAFAARPDVLVLDEPAGGLDPIARRELIDEIVEILSDNRSCTVVFSTHILSDLERIAEQVGIMDRGRLLMQARLEDIQNTIKRVQVIFESDRVPDNFVIPGTLSRKVEGPVVNAVVRISRESDLDDLRKQTGVRINVFPLGLEELFITLLGPNGAGELKEVA
jgi:ABC-2 type transport system ATP-binding protein